MGNLCLNSKTKDFLFTVLHECGHGTALAIDPYLLELSLNSLSEWERIPFAQKLLFPDIDFF